MKLRWIGCVALLVALSLVAYSCGGPQQEESESTVTEALPSDEPAQEVPSEAVPTEATAGGETQYACLECGKDGVMLTSSNPGDCPTCQKALSDVGVTYKCSGCEHEQATAGDCPT